MRATSGIAALGLAVTLTAAGCSDKAEEISSASYVFSLLQKAWANARQTLGSSEPTVGPLYSVGVVLTQRLPRQMEQEYQGPDKQEVMAKLNSLVEAYREKISSKLMVTAGGVAMRPGVTLEELKEAFAELDPQYRELEKMIGG